MITQSQWPFADEVALLVQGLKIGNKRTLSPFSSPVSFMRTQLSKSTISASTPMKSSSV